MARLPPDGSPILNRLLQMKLERELETPISIDQFSAALDRLAAKEVIGRLRGQNAQVFLTTAQHQPLREIQKDAWTEAQLMEPLEHYLTERFWKGLDLPKGSTHIVHNTSAMGPYLGRWARPDYILVTAMHFNLLPGSQIDVHSFELKTETGATDQSVYEALAQTRFTHFGHLVWHLPPASKAEEQRLQPITAQCEEHGVGLILLRNPKQLEQTEIILDPVRKNTLPVVVDGFLQSRLLPNQREHLLKFLNGGRK
jgi:hypothetical protein